MRLKGKVLPIALAVMMTVSQAPVSVFAAEDVSDNGEQIEIQVDEDETSTDFEESEGDTAEGTEEAAEEVTEEVTEEAAEEVSEETPEEVTDDTSSEETAEGAEEEEETETAPVEEKVEKAAESEELIGAEEAKKENIKEAEAERLPEAEKATELDAKKAEDAKAEEAKREADLRAAKTYTVTYVDGKTNSNPTSYKKSSKDIKLTNPTWKGYTFRGWYYDSDFTRRATMIKAGSTGDRTFYAKWEANKYKVAFDGNGATSGTMKNMTCAYASSYVLRANKFSRKGYDFTGWNTKANGSGKAYTDQAEIANLNSNAGAVVTLYAQWKPHSYKVQFKGYRADSGSMSTISCKYGRSYTLPANTFKKRGYTFVGWNTKCDGSGRSFKNSEAIKNLTAVDGNTLTLYTQWTKTQYKINYQLSGGTNNAKNPTSYNLTTNTITLKGAARKGYIFEGWYSDSSYTKQVTTIPKGSVGNKTLYAKWSLREYKINYNFNGGSYSGALTTRYYVTSDNIVLPTPVKTGYKFAGWYRSSDFSGARVYNFNTGSYGTINVYAKWIPITYTVVFNGNGADGGYTGSMTCTYDQVYNVPNCGFTKSGKKFWGWSLNSEDGSDCTSKIKNLTTTDGATVTLYAQWASAVNIVRTESYPIYNIYKTPDGTSATLMGITSITYDYRDYGNGKYDIIIHVKYEKVANSEKFAANYNVGARYTIYDPNGNIIKAGSIVKSGLTTGQGATTDITLEGVGAGDYVIDFNHYQ